MQYSLVAQQLSKQIAKTFDKLSFVYLFLFNQAKLLSWLLVKLLQTGWQSC